MSENLTTKQIEDWANLVINDIETFRKSLTTVSGLLSTDGTKSLRKITKSADPTLSQSFADLDKMVDKTNTKLKTAATGENKGLKARIKQFKKDIEDAEKEATESAAKAVDQFAEIAEEIGKIEF